MPGCCCSFCFSIYDLAKIKLQFIEINKRSLRLSSLKQRGVGSLFSSLFFLALCLHAALHHPNAWNRLEDYAKGTTKQRLQQRNKKQRNLRGCHIGRWIRRGSELSFRIFSSLWSPYDYLSKAPALWIPRYYGLFPCLYGKLLHFL